MTKITIFEITNPNIIKNILDFPEQVSIFVKNSIAYITCNNGNERLGLFDGRIKNWYYNGKTIRIHTK